MENLAWEIFSKTGSIDCYLLYKQSMDNKENSDDYGTNQNEWRGNQANQGQRE